MAYPRVTLTILERAKASLSALFPANTEREDLRRQLEKIEDACLVQVALLRPF